MNWNLRTYIRLFLVVGGGVFLVVGAIAGDLFQIALSVVALLLGGGGLAVEWRETATKD